MKELREIQQRLKAPKQNEARNKGVTMYKYRSCEQVLQAVKPLLEELKCTLTLWDDMVFAGERYYIKATAVLTNDNGEQEISTGFAREPETLNAMNAAQVTGACSSYARKYALNGLFALDDTKDADDAAAEAMASWRKEFSAASTIDEVKAIWYKYAYLQHDPDFAAMKEQRKAELSK